MYNSLLIIFVYNFLDVKKMFCFFIGFIDLLDKLDIIWIEVNFFEKYKFVSLIKILNLKG